MLYRAPEVVWRELKPRENETVRYEFGHPLNYYVIKDNPDNNTNKPYIVCYGGREFKECASIQDAKDWVEHIHFPSVINKAGFKPVNN